MSLYQSVVPILAVFMLTSGCFGRPREGRMSDDDVMRARLVELRQEHRDLDDAIAAMTQSPPYDQIRAQRLKKRKLVLKDVIIRIENQLMPDIIA